MNKFTRISEFAEQLFGDQKSVQHASEIIEGILEARSPRISDIASRMPGGEAANYKRVQRFLECEDPRQVLKLLFNEEAEFVIGDSTEIERPYAHRTDYVGTLKDGETKGFWLLTLATPVRGRAIPFHFLTYSSRTLDEQVGSRNLEHFKAIEEIQLLIGSRPIVFDREFSYLLLLKSLVSSGMQFVIRLNLGSKPPKFYYDAEQKRELRLAIAPINNPQIYRQVYYKGEVPLNLIGIWQHGFKQPIWIMTNLEPEAGLELYFFADEDRNLFPGLEIPAASQPDYEQIPDHPRENDRHGDAGLCHQFGDWRSHPRCPICADRSPRFQSAAHS